MCPSLGGVVPGRRLLPSLAHTSCHLGTQQAAGLLLHDVFPFLFPWSSLGRKMDDILGKDKKINKGGNRESLSLCLSDLIKQSINL